MFFFLISVYFSFFLTLPCLRYLFMTLITQSTGKGKDIKRELQVKFEYLLGWLEMWNLEKVLQVWKKIEGQHLHRTSIGFFLFFFLAYLMLSTPGGNYYCLHFRCEKRESQRLIYPFHIYQTPKTIFYTTLCLDCLESVRRKR